MAIVRFQPAERLSGTVRVPADKSLTHRALLLAALSAGRTRIRGALDAEDTASTAGAIAASGVRVSGDLGDEITVDGRGLRGLRPPPAIDCGNSGTLMRLLPGILVGQQCDRVVLDGDESLRRRPMGRVADPLRAMGASIWTAPGGTPPLAVSGGEPLDGQTHELAVASAQVKSCLLLAGLVANGVTRVIEPGPSRDHTERMLEAAGADVRRHDDGAEVAGPVESIQLPDMEIPGDPSSAAPLAVAAALLADPDVRLTGVALNPRRTGFFEVMTRMGVDIEMHQTGEVAGEPVGDLVVRRGSGLSATEVGGLEVPTLIDELPLVALLGALAKGTTRVTGAAELRVKESDRIATVAGALRSLGVLVDEDPDGFSVRGSGRIPGGRMDAAGDHRIAMLGAIAGLLSEDGVAVGGFESVGVSYPGFAADLVALGVEA
jgi:3-phosphoshikimate 1-carboxyvinyltransferase